jgi:sigma-B regulation protein RsbU (phosphoserine phosphatase)
MTSTTTEPYRIQCASIWGGIEVVDREICTGGISASVLSTASGHEKGGDIYYFSVCSSDKLTRIAIADVRGHGERVSHLSQWLYESLEARMNSLDGAGVLSDLNGLAHSHGFDALTTAAVAGYYTGNASLYYSYAGHPPILMRKSAQSWGFLPLENGKAPANLPLGVMRNARYDQAIVKLERGDRIFLYTDGLIECTNPAGEFFGEARLLETLERTAGRSTGEIKQAVRERLTQFAGGPLVDDDCTLMAVEVVN